MEGVELSARYALPPNSRGLCGTPRFADAARRLFRGEPSDTGRQLRGFAAHFKYLELIAEKSFLGPFDRRVAEALWIGNGLLEKVRREDLRRLILDRLTGPGMLSRDKAAELAAGVPEGAVPHHSFHVLYVGSVTGKVKMDGENIDRCCVTWGKVVELSARSALVLSRPVSRVDGALSLGEPRKKRVSLRAAGVRLAGKLRRGDLVTMHWGVAVQKITKEAADALERYTLRNMQAVNSLR